MPVLANGHRKPIARPMQSFRPGDVVKVPFPYSDGQPRHNRPALVVACVGPAGEPFLLWVLMITSAANRPWPGDIAIDDLAAAGLPAASIVRTEKIATIEAKRASVIGVLSNDVMVGILDAMGQRLNPAKIGVPE